MWKSFLNVAIRNIKKHRVFSFINIVGLAISMSVCLLIIMLIKDAYKFDKFHPKSDQIYRVLTDANRKGGGSEPYATSPFPLGETFNNEFSYSDLWVPLVRRPRGNFKIGNKTIAADGLMTNQNFFKLFGFEISQGNLDECLKNPFQLVLTKSTAQKFFGNQDPIGKTLDHEDYGTFTVTGVLEEFPGKTHLEFDLLASLSTLPILENSTSRPINIKQNWNDYYSTYQFIRLKESITRDKAENALHLITQERYADITLESRDESYQFRLQPINKITPGPILSNSMGRGLPEFLLWFLMALGFIVIFSACFNYTNLTIARSLVRAKEVGIRKTIGAKSSHIFLQFLSESIFVSLVALLIALILVKMTVPLFNKLQFLEFTDVSIIMDAPTLFWFVVFAVLVGSIAGILPAALFSRFRPLDIIQRFVQTSRVKKLSLRKILVVTQFTVSLIFLVLLTIAWKQTHFAIQGNFGFLDQTMLNLDLQNEPFHRVNAKMEQLSSVKRISAISHLMGTFEDSKVDVRIEAIKDKVPVRDYFIDHRYLDNFNISLVAGRGFPELLNQENEQFAIVNPTFLDQFQLGLPQEAIGKSLIIEDSLQLNIIGVTEDFLYKPLSNELEPLLLRYDPNRLQFLNIQLHDADVSQSLVALEKSWEEVSEITPVVYSFYHESIQENFANLFDIIWIVAYFGILGIIIACLGLLGMTIYAAEVKAKEVSIRKVVGASSFQLVKLLSNGFIWILLIACLVAIPASYFLGQQILQIFAFRIPIGISCFIPGIILLLGFGLSTIGSQTINAARSNPVKHLHNE